MNDPAAEKPLHQRLREASAQELVALIETHAEELTGEAVRHAMRNPFVTVEVIEILMAQGALLAIYEVRSAIARHPKTPQVHTQRLIPALFWRDLMELTLDMRVLPVVRRSAEKQLIQRLPAITVGEKISMARRVGPGILFHLRWEADPRIFRALLENPRTTEGLLLPLVSSEKAAPEILQTVAASANWGNRYTLRRALCRNARTPVALVLRLLPRLKRPDLKALTLEMRLSSVIRERARKLLGN